ncbi:hypothetical protein [Raineya sp.]
METKAAERLVAAIKKVSNASATLATGKVVSIDAETHTCDIELDSEGADIFGVRLRAVVDDANGLILVPKINSEVVIAKINTSQWVVVATAELESIKILIGSQTLIIDENGFVFNEGNLGGLVKLNDLVSKLNAIENKVNSIISHYNSHNHAHPQGPTTGLLVPFSDGNLTLTQKSDLENQHIKQ